MRPLSALASLLASLSFCLSAHAQVAPGNYAMHSGGGDLQIKAAKSGKQNFTISTIGANFHSCGAEGVITGKLAILTEGDERCELKFDVKNGANGALTVSNNGKCQYYCGMRASLDGEFWPLPAACQSKERQQARKAFKALYDKKNYEEAAAKLDQVVANCGKFVDQYEGAWISNDLALTYHKLQNDKRCLELLQPYAEDAGKNEAAIRDSYLPSEADSWLPVLKATRTNLRLCKGGK